jgi:hypothetical protein
MQYSENILSQYRRNTPDFLTSVSSSHLPICMCTKPKMWLFWVSRPYKTCASKKADGVSLTFVEQEISYKVNQGFSSALLRTPLPLFLDKPPGFYRKLSVEIRNNLSRSS